MSYLQRIDEISIAPAAAATWTAARLRTWAAAQGRRVIVEEEEEPSRAAADLAITPSKRHLRVVKQAGAVLKPCTGRTDSLLCCNLHVVTQTVGCPLDCTYCILQDYQNRSRITVQADPADILARLSAELARQPRRLFRICTGQVADSLALEPEIGFVEAAVQHVARLDNVVLELKTKTDRVAWLLSLPHQGRTIISWSLNLQQIIQEEEHGAATLEARLAAARHACAAGYLVAFHFDPLIITAMDAPDRYRALMRHVLETVPTQQIAYLSLGTIRFLPSMRRTIIARFPASRVTQGELLPDVDGKLRLLSPLRVAIYRSLAEEAHRRCPDLFLYLCMEPERIWRRALGTSYGCREEVERALAESLHDRFRLAPCFPDPADYPPIS